MKTPTDEEATAIAAALLRYATQRVRARPVADSSWRETARCEGVLANVPRTWRG